MPKSSRPSRSRPRPRRAVSAPPATTSAAPEAPSIPVQPAAPVPVAPSRTARRTPAGLSAAISQRSFTDYAYIIGELKRIFVITGVIIVLMLVIWFIIG